MNMDVFVGRVTRHANERNEKDGQPLCFYDTVDEAVVTIETDLEMGALIICM